MHGAGANRRRSTEATVERAASSGRERDGFVPLFPFKFFRLHSCTGVVAKEVCPCVLLAGIEAGKKTNMPHSLFLVMELKPPASAAGCRGVGPFTAASILANRKITPIQCLGLVCLLTHLGIGAPNLRGRTLLDV